MMTQRSNSSLRSLSGLTILLFGLMALVLGAVGIFRPQALLKSMGFAAIPKEERQPGDYTHLFVLTSSMASFNMGVYYILAAVTGVRQFFAWTVPFRVVTFTVFTTAVALGYAPIKFLAVPVWEGIGALLTGLALRREAQQQADG
jgi:hypothetical protein